ncbi:PREDICTED: RNA polymerase II C-terminal domain phosphatase-like 4 isoform X2 [Ipomoea nil]|uniref:RNA polymerase II C-terminal domain phosphatase-like 4 isoform X2 n=1 Tax=Ipomoea nil TaxID=35883 RepID=UPI000901B671|nr:PREDICTED: RNA polymerase II C-terminal domain phosphatase-like 4 isoform X2 [Ipomoea nil]
MSLTVDSPAHSSSSDDLAAFLDAELETASGTSSELEDVEAEVEEGEEEGKDDEEQYEDENEDWGEDGDGKDNSDASRIKRRRVAIDECTGDTESSKSRGEPAETSVKMNTCTHPGVIGGMCIRCGQLVDDESGVSFGYIHKNLKLTYDEVARLREKDLKNLLQHKKLYLVLDLDHTVLNSTRISDISAEEEYLKDTLPDALKSSLFRLDRIHMMTKLRPFVNNFLKEASDLFEMYIYTMGERPYALEMAKLLDPRDVYFHSRVIAQGDSTQRHQKGLDIVLGQESSVLILDDTEVVWGKHKENLILMDRYHFFASSCQQFGFDSKSLSQLKSDESEENGALATVLAVLKRIHGIFFDQKRGDNLLDRDVREVLKGVRKEVLEGCKIVFSRVFPTKFHAENHHLWRMAEQLGATCTTELDQSVTHVVSMDAGTEKSRWAQKENKFLVHPKWIEAANYLWKKQAEENFPVTVSVSTTNNK